jgi:hypothetical protein
MDEDQIPSQVENEPEEQLDQSTNEEQLDNVEDEAEEEDEDLSPRQQKRVDQIEAQAKEYKFNKILDRIQNTRTAATPVEESKPLNYRDVIEADDELFGVLEKDRETAVANERASVNQALLTSEWRTNIKLDLPLVKERLDKLDPADAEALDREYLLISQFDGKTGNVGRNDIGYADFIEARVEQAERLASNMNLRSQKQIAKQAANTGVRPDGGARSSFKIQNPGDIANMSSEDYEKNRAAIYKQLGMPYNK